MDCATYIPTMDTPLLTTYKAMGLTILGKTNTSEFGLTPTTDSRSLGACGNPWNIAHSAGGSSGGDSIVVETEHLVDVIEACWWLTSRRVRYKRSPSWGPQLADNGHGAKLPENPTNITLSGQNDK